MKEKKIINLLPSSYILSKNQQKMIYGGDPYPYSDPTDPGTPEPAVCHLPLCSVQSDCNFGKVCTSFEFCSSHKHCF